jgi:oxygen-independent coproporphyrinogen-3 oxidase
VRDSTVGVYVHIPFCERVCPYCDFAVIATPELPADQEARYVDALLRELASRKAVYQDAIAVNPGPTATSQDPSTASSRDPDAAPSQAPNTVPIRDPDAASSQDPDAAPSRDANAAPSRDPNAARSQDADAASSQDPGASPSRDFSAAPSRNPDGMGRRLASVYLGGGTPALLAPESLAKIVDGIRAAFSVDGPVEITLEVNPSTLERDRLPEFRALGVNRVSVGVQSFDDAVLKCLGRAHRVEEAHQTLAACRAAGFQAISLDLIFAAPGQRLAGVEADIARALEFGPDHVSTYELTIESGTPFALAASRGQLSLPDEDEAIAMMETLEDRLRVGGFVRYEISNYARPGFQAVHNRRYWERQPVLGLGVGAFSTEPRSAAAPFGARRSNVRDLRTYLDRIAQRRPTAAGPTEVFDADTARGEAAFLGLRGSRGLLAVEFESEFGQPPRVFFGPVIDRLIESGLLDEAASGDLRLSARGRLLADSVFAEFV